MKPITFKALFDYSKTYLVKDRVFAFELVDCVPTKKYTSFRPIIGGKTIDIKNKIVRVLETVKDKKGIEIITKCEIYSVRANKLKLIATL